MPFLQPANPNPLQMSSSPMMMEASAMDVGSNSPISNQQSPPSSFNFGNQIGRGLHSPTPAHLRSRTRRPSSLSLGLDRIKPFNPPSAASLSAGSAGSSAAIPGLAGGGVLAPMLQASPVIFDSDPNLNNIASRGRASSTASTMSFGFSPSRRSLSLEDTGNPMDDIEDTPNANTTSRRHVSRMSANMSLKRRHLGMSNPNGSESSLSNASNGRRTPDLMAYNAAMGHRRLEDDVSALAVDPDARSSPDKDNMPMTPPSAVAALPGGQTVTGNGPLKPAQLLKLQRELTAPFADSETRSEAAFSRLVQSTSDLASRLRLTTPSASPARIGKRQPRNWMAAWAANNGLTANTTQASVAGRFPEQANAEEREGSDDSESEGEVEAVDGVGEATLVLSRPPSALGHASGAMPIGIATGRSRSGSVMTANGDMMMLGSYGGGLELVDGGMDLDMMSNMSSPVSTPATNSWREPAGFFPSKKRKLVEAEYQPQAKKRKGVSPHGTAIPLAPSGGSGSGSSQSLSPFVFPQPKSPHQGFPQLSMTSISSSSSGASGHQLQANSYFSPYGTPSFSGAPMGTSVLGMTGVGGAGMGHHHRKSGSITNMTWSRPGSAQSSPLMRPTSSQGPTGVNMPAPPGLLLGPSLLSQSTTTATDNSAPANPSNAGSFSFNFSNARSSASGAMTSSPLSSSLSGVGSSNVNPPAVQPYPTFPSHSLLGQYGAPLTASPTNRPMMKLPDRALHHPVVSSSPSRSQGNAAPATQPP